MLRDKSLIPLSHQHHNGLSLCILTERALDQDSGAGSVLKQARRCIDRFEIELVNHFEVEEQVLFPATASPLTAELIAEHRGMERLIDQIRAVPTEALLREFTALLRRHIRREENELFESIQKELSRGTLDALGEEIDSKLVRVCLE
jgi:hemerythrin-like domain-containing protein